MQILRRRISGEADAHDERQLQAAAEEDAFVRDAVEGLEAFPEGDHAERITRLKGRLRQRTGRRALTPVLLIRRVAAAAVLVGLAGLGIWWMLRQPDSSLSDKSIAIQETVTSPALVEETPPEIAAAEETPTTRMPPPAPAPRMAPAPPGMEDAAPPSVAQRKEEVTPVPPAIAADESPKAEGPAAARPAATTPPADVAAIIEAEPVETKRPAATGQAAERSAANFTAPAAPAATAKPASRTLRGKVTDASGEPLIGATVLLQGTNTGTVTDMDGAYALNVPADMPSPKLVVSYTGYETVTVTPGQSDRMNIVVPDGGAALSEVVVVGRSSKKSSRTAAVQTGVPLYPVGGFAALEAHIEKNKRLPDYAPAPAEVELEFSVSTQGRLRNFRAIRSPGPAYTDEAIRLLRSGPRWENSSGDEQQAKFTVVF